MIAREEVATRLSKILVEHLGVTEGEVKPDTLLVPDHDPNGVKLNNGRADLGADSLDVVELVMAAEEEFRIEITDDEAEPLNRATVGELVDFVHQRLN